MSSKRKIGPVEGGVEMPPDRRGPKGPWKYPWDDMRVGDSFFVRLRDAPSGGGSNVAQLGNRVRPGLRFASRKVRGGYRIFRTA